MIEVIGVLIAAGDGEDAGAQDVGDAVRDQVRVTWVADQSGKLIGDAQATLRGGQQHHAAV
jgi:hypothetical protein